MEAGAAQEKADDFRNLMDAATVKAAVLKKFISDAAKMLP